MRHYAKLLRSTLTASITLVAIAGAAVAGPLEDAAAAYDKGEFDTALLLIRPLTNQGNAPAQWLLGQMYDQGRGVPQDYAGAMKWYRLAQGFAQAQFNLALMYEAGFGTQPDYAEAIKWCRKAAEQGLARAQAYLGFIRAANQGNAMAQSNLGFMYLTGDGVPQDFVQAYMWFNLAAAATKAKDTNIAAEERDKVAAKMTPAQIAEAQKLAREWKAKPER
jgi:uncharacterized protein